MYGKTFSSLSSLLLLLFLFSNCEKDDPQPVVDAQIVASPSKLLLNDDQSVSLFLSVQPPAPFEWQITQQPDWLVFSAEAGTINADIVEIKVTGVPTGLSPGKHFGTIEIITNGAGVVEIETELCVEALPEAVLSPSSLKFEAYVYEQVLTLSNVGTGFLDWHLADGPAWVSFHPQQGILDAGQSREIIVLLSSSGLPVGTQTGQAVLRSNSIKGDLALPLTAEIPGVASLIASTNFIAFDYFTSEQRFLLENQGNITSNWSLNNDHPYLKANTSAGTLSPGSATEIVLTLDRSAWQSTQQITTQISIADGSGQLVPLDVLINHFHETKWLIPDHIIDAEYSRSLDLIVAISEAPNRLRLFDPGDLSETSIPLNLVPTCVSVGPNGNFAAVGHLGGISYIDLRNKRVVKTYAVTTNAYDIVLADNGYAYVFPQKDQWERIRCIHLDTGVETQHEGNFIYEQTRAKLHPSGTAIYGANNFLSPSDFEKYGIARGTASYEYNSPYHGDYDFGGDIWIARDGKRLFARSRNVFNASENTDHDMTYNGQLVGEGQVFTLDHSLEADRVYAIFSPEYSWDRQPAAEVRRYGAEFLAFQGVTLLPGFLIGNGAGGGEVYPAEGHFGFFDAAGTVFHVLVRARPGSSPLPQWAIVSLAVE